MPLKTMNLNLSAIALFPLLLTQGLYVRKFTPKLPEATGPREGVHGNGKKPVNLLILGDSAAAGVGAKHQKQALSGQILHYLHQDFIVNWQLEAQTGRTTQDTLSLIKSKPAQSVDVIVLSLGVNDVTSGVSPKQWLFSQRQLVAKLKHKFSCRLIIHSAVPPMHLFSALPHPLKWYLGKEARKLNTVLREGLLSDEESQLVELTGVQDPALLAEDGFHPSEKLYSVWGRQVAQVINTIWNRNIISQADNQHTGC